MHRPTDETASNTPSFMHVDSVLDEFLHPEDIALQNVRTNSMRHGLPDIAVSPQQAKHLELLCRIARAQTTLEIGTLGGYSTVALARGTEKEVVSLEFSHKHARVARDNLKIAGVSDKVDIYIGRAMDTLPLLHRQQVEGVRHPFDFVFIDADKENNAAYFRWAVRMTNPGGVILVDNVVRDGRVLDPGRPEKFEFIKQVGENSFTDACVIQTVGSKGWDGYVLAVVK